MQNILFRPSNTYQIYKINLFKLHLKQPKHSSINTSNAKLGSNIDLRKLDFFSVEEISERSPFVNKYVTQN